MSGPRRSDILVQERGQQILQATAGSGRGREEFQIPSAPMIGSSPKSSACRGQRHRVRLITPQPFAPNLSTFMAHVTVGIRRLVACAADGFVRSHGPAEERANEGTVNLQLRYRPPATYPVSRGRCRTVRSRRRSTAPPRLSPVWSGPAVIGELGGYLGVLATVARGQDARGLGIDRRRPKYVRVAEF
jgi:hypothetical protein